MINKKRKVETKSQEEFSNTQEGLYKYVPSGLVKFCVDISTIKLFDKNPRRNDIAVADLAKGIKESMFRKPIVIDQNNVIRAGNTAYKAALKLGMKMIPVAQSHFENEDAAVKYVIGDNKLGEKSAWDLDVLKDLLVAHNMVDAKSREGTGLLDVEVNRLFDIKEQAEKTLKHTIEVAVTCDTEATARTLYDRLTKEGFTCRVLTL
jgi:hypothetical protein